MCYINDHQVEMIEVKRFLMFFMQRGSNLGLPLGGRLKKHPLNFVVIYSPIGTASHQSKRLLDGE